MAKFFALLSYKDVLVEARSILKNVVSGTGSDRPSNLYHGSKMVDNDACVLSDMASYARVGCFTTPVSPIRNLS